MFVLACMSIFYLAIDVEMKHDWSTYLETTGAQLCEKHQKWSLQLRHHLYLFPSSSPSVWLSIVSIQINNLLIWRYPTRSLYGSSRVRKYNNHASKFNCNKIFIQVIEVKMPVVYKNADMLVIVDIRDISILKNAYYLNIRSSK